MVKKLNEDSQIIGKPDKLKLPLKRHQSAMLYKCLNIEKNALINKYPFGIMSDKAGAGKTAVIISLILADKLINGKTQNIIIVPQNIHTQWINEIKKFSGDELSVISFVKYSDICDLYHNSNILTNNDIIITTSMYYETILTIIQQNNYKIKRVILDEIDSMASILNSIKEKEDLKIKAKNEFTNNFDSQNQMEITQLNTQNNKIIWLISASIDNAIDENGLSFQDKLISHNQLNEIMCKCEDEFIDKYNFVLESPEIITKIADNVSDDYFNFLSVNQLDSLNSLSFHNIHGKYTNKIASDSAEAISIIAEDYLISINNLTENLVKLTSHLNNNNIKPEEYTKLKEQINSEQKIIDFSTIVLNSIHDIGITNCNCITLDNKYKCLNENLVLLNKKYINTKIKYLEEFFSSFDSSKDKILIFSDFTDSFKTVSYILNKKNVKYTELNSGNISGIDKSISNYKNGDYSVLLIDSSNEGCGMNLENTTHIIFLHKTSEILYNQIVGRAQRSGRVGQLKIITLLHKNEQL